MAMNIQDFFHSSADRIAEFAEVQTLLYRHDAALQDYFLPLQLDSLTGPRINLAAVREPERIVSSVFRGADMVTRLRAKKTLKADVLLCPNQDFSRRAESQFFLRVLMGLAETGAKILCLLPDEARRRVGFESRLRAAGRHGQVTFLDPTPSQSLDARLCSVGARRRSRSVLKEVVRILEPHGLAPSEEILGGLKDAAYFAEAWERLAPWVEFDAVVARCHWLPLCSPVCRTALQRGKKVITFQQGVVGMTLDVPVSATKYVAFGQTSAALLARVNRSFFEAVEMPEPSVKYVTGGSLFDTVTALPDQFEQQTVLLVDLPVPPGDFYGMQVQADALVQLAGKLLAAPLPLRRLVIRPHPHWTNLDLEICKRLVRDNPERCELSHPAWALEDDLRRSSVVAGIFSGVLTVASACGLPSIFLQTERGFTTEDLACFGPGQTLFPDAAFDKIAKMLTDRAAYHAGRAQALANAREYYANGTDLRPNGEFFARLLERAPVNAGNGTGVE